MASEFEIPSVDDHDGVKAAEARRAELSAELDAVRRERRELARAVGPDATKTERELRARAVFDGSNVDAKLKAIGELAALADREQVLADAVGLATAAVQDARATAGKELSAACKAGLYADQERAAAVAYLAFCRENAKLCRLGAALTEAGLGRDYPWLFPADVPAHRSHSNMASKLRELIGRGFIEKDDVEAALPRLLELNR